MHRVGEKIVVTSDGCRLSRAGNGVALIFVPRRRPSSGPSRIAEAMRPALGGRRGLFRPSLAPADSKPVRALPMPKAMRQCKARTLPQAMQLVTRKFYAPRRIPSPKKTTGTPQRARRTARPPYRHGCHLRLTDPPRFAQTAEGVKAGHVWAVRCKNSRDLCGGALDCEDWDAFPK